MASIRKDIICRTDDKKVRLIDENVKNAWRWQWLEEKVGDTFLRDVFRKIDKPGFAYCIICCKEISYGSRGIPALINHVTHGKKHLAIVEARKNNFSLPGTGDCQQKFNVQYGIHPMLNPSSVESQPSQPTLTPISDRILNNEALILSFIAEKSLPFSLVPDLVELIKYMSKDKKALDRMHMSRTAASYKLRFGVAKTFADKLSSDLKNAFFSLNVDESTSNNHNRVVTILVNYVDSHKSIVTKHLSSFALNVVDSNSLFKHIDEVISGYEIPWDNLMSILLDSCNVMRGRKAGLELKLREKCPHLLDIDGDTCHHAHNAAKAFCKPFDMYIEKLSTDVHNDFKWSPDLRAALSHICGILNIKYTMPECFNSIRWLSAYDVALDLQRLFDGLVLFYYSFLSYSDKQTYLHVIVRCYKVYKLSEPSKESIRVMHSTLSQKNMTEAGKDRKKRIVDKLFHNQTKTKITLGFFISTLPMLQAYIKFFESGTPQIHKLYAKQKELLVTFFGCFMKPEILQKMKSARKLKELNVSDSRNHLSPHSFFIGETAKNIILQARKSQMHIVEDFQKLASEAYINCAKSLQAKMPFCNPFLIIASSIDPLERKQSCSLSRMKKLPEYVSNVLKEEERELYDKEVHMYMSDPSLREPKEEEAVEEWWKYVDASGKYKILSKMVFSLLTCFHGPKVESSFSIMNNIITQGTSSLNVNTFSAIQTVKYELFSHKKTAVQLFKKDDFLSESVDKILCKNLLNSAKMCKEAQQKNLALKQEKKKFYQIKEKKILTKKAAKKLLGDAAKLQRVNHVSKLKKASKVICSSTKNIQTSKILPSTIIDSSNTSMPAASAEKCEENSDKGKKRLLKISSKQQPKQKKLKTDNTKRIKETLTIKAMFENMS